MKNLNPDPLGIPVYLKTTPEDVLPKDKFYYLLASNGLFIGRNHKWFQSLAKAESGPKELAEQKETCTLTYPDIPRALVERAVGFFHKVYQAHQWESALILVWNQQTNTMELLCPEQKASAGSVHYEVPKDLPPHLLVMGDLHSHGDWSPHASYTDEQDEMHRPGLHIVVGHIKDEPPQWHIEVVVDGTRYKVESIFEVIEGYHQRDPASVPPEWMKKVKEHKYSWQTTTTGRQYQDYYGGIGGGGGGYEGYGVSYGQQTKEDREVIKRVLADFLRKDEKPTAEEVSQVLFHETKHSSYIYCDAKAEKFLKHWDKAKANMHLSDAEMELKGE